MSVRMGTCARWEPRHELVDGAHWDDGQAAAPMEMDRARLGLDWSAVRAKLSSFLSLTLLSNHYPALHGARVLAIFAVVQHHLTSGLIRNHVVERSAVTRFSHNLFFGMDLFFILSGFLIGSVLLQQSGNERGMAGLGKFYARRAFRTFPLYYAVLLWLVFFGASHKVLGAELLYFTNYATGGLRHAAMDWGWSLCVEEHFYLLAPLLLLVLGVIRRPGTRLGVLVGLWLLGLGLRLEGLLSHVGPWGPSELFTTLYIKTHTRFDILVAGVAVAHLQHEHGAWLRQKLARRAVAWSLVVVSILALAFLVMPLGPLLGRGLYKVLSWGTMTSIMYVPFLLLLLNRPGPWARFLGAPVFRRAATLGYGVYLVHIPVLAMVTPPVAGLGARLGLDGVRVGFLVFVISMGLSFCAAYGLHLLIEKPALVLRDRLVPRCCP